MNGGLEVVARQSGPVPLDAELHCEAGKLLALVGPSGSGKTTLLRVIAGLTRPAYGRVVCNGETLLDTDTGTNLSPQQRGVGFVFQNYALMPHLGALDNVRLALLDVPEPERTAQARALLERVNLAGLEQRSGRQLSGRHLSGGEQQRVALARALARKPRMLLLDEPFAAVDQVTRHRLRMELAAFVRELEIPMVLVTHDLDEACMLADSICVLRRGCTLQQGSADTVLRHPVSADVAHLVDLRNLFRGRLRRDPAGGAELELEWEGGVLRVDPPAGFADGEEVDWCVPADHVLLVPLRAEREEGENGLYARVSGLLAGSGVARVILVPEAAPGIHLHLELPVRVAHRHGLELGRRLKVSLPRGSIHVMRGDDRAPGPEVP